MASMQPTAEAMHTAEATEEATPWAETQTRWSEAGTTFLATVRPDGGSTHRSARRPLVPLRTRCTK